MSARLSNIERMRQLYDPNYVRRVDTLDEAPVQVCVEDRMLTAAAGTGVATYARTLAACLPAAGASPLLLGDGPAGPVRRARLGRWIAATRAGARLADVAAPDEAAAHWVVRDLFREAHVFFNLHGRLLPVEFDRPPQVMHWTYPLPLYLRGARNLYTIHDLIPLTHPELTRVSSTRHAAVLRQIAAHAYGLVTVSETVRRQLVDHLGIPEGRVVNTLQAIDAPLQSDPSLPPGLRSGDYFFFCGRVEPRKNLDRLACAHAASGTALPLVIVGPQVPGEEALEKTLRGFAGVIRLPWMPRRELLGMMRRARALLFPSLAEGFGLPIAEAMTLGCPVLTSSAGAPAEIAGDAALLVDPRQTAQIEVAIRRLESDEILRARLRAAGFARGLKFTPDVYARRLRALYADAIATAPRGRT
ncbi:glycosyltransferase family 4 protein [Sphingomonas psychrotolerans]|uniref:Glycosyltransferase family 1 protein n=1 Tax=Sphingomonas psychrotolerans TaxID=1327635 RepID=A0A2K8MK32_9SPHN|nr:glycosyltransferase family 1 protein [Sphingomonas psychrotolerans]ATY34240.1 glycosyltransferase family 1 protein [Sphingomonas psychrotolerans]